MPRRRVDTTKVQNVLRDVPNVYLSDIDVEDIKQQRLINLLLDYGITTTSKLSEYTDADLIDQYRFGPYKLEKLVELIILWKKNNYPLKTVNPAKPDDICNSLMKNVFLNSENLIIPSMRWNLNTFETIANHLGQSKQNVSVKERGTEKRFLKWYQQNNLSERIGTYDDFRLYCEKNFTEDQRSMLDAVRRLVSLTK